VTLTSEEPQPTREPALSALLQEWVAAGLISADQASAIREHQGRHRPEAPEASAGRSGGGRTAAPAGSLVVEALGYLGGIIMVVGAVILVTLYWQDLPTAVRLLLVGATAVALVAAGFAVPTRLGAAALRLRSVLWALAVAATITFMAVLSTDVLDRQDESQLVVIGPCTALVAGALWWWRRTWLQQVALMVPLVLTAAGLAYEVGGLDTSWYGGFSFILAVGWSALAYTGRLEPRVSGVAIGGLVATFSALTIDTDLGVGLALATAATLVAVALWERSLPWLAVAAVSVLESAPRAAVQWFPGRLSASITLILTGGLLVLAAVWIARHQAGKAATETPAEKATGGRTGGRPPARAG